MNIFLKNGRFHGTTGYEFMVVSGVFLCSHLIVKLKLHELYQQVTSNTVPFEEIADENASDSFFTTRCPASGDVIHQSLTASQKQHRHSRDFTHFSLQDALEVIIACFPATARTFPIAITSATWTAIALIR